MIFDALQLARGWLSVAIASSDDKDRPALHRTVSIEQYATGARLVATDSYMLLRAWVPNLEGGDLTEPGLDETPFATGVAMDLHGRGRGFLGHLLGLASGENAELVEVRLSLGVVDPEEDSPRTLGGMDARWVVLEHPDIERLKLVTYEGEYPAWRKVTAGFSPMLTPAVALNPEILARLGKLGKLHGNNPIRWHFGGNSGMARLVVADSDPWVEGAVMPMRWDFDRDLPRDVTIPGEDNEE